MLAFGWLFMSPAAGDDPLTVAAKQIENLNSAVDKLDYKEGLIDLIDIAENKFMYAKNLKDVRDTAIVDYQDAVEAEELALEEVNIAQSNVDEQTALASLALENKNNALNDKNDAQDVLDLANINLQTAQSNMQSASGTGLQYTVYNLTRTWPSIATPSGVICSGTWNSSSMNLPVCGNRYENIIVKFTGQITVPSWFTTVAFAGYTDDGFRMFINGNLAVNNWVEQGARWSAWSPTYNVSEDKTLDVEIWWYNGGGPGSYHLGWTIPGGMTGEERDFLFLKESIPESATYSVAGVGRYEFKLAELSIKHGGHVRVGLEDNIYISKGVKAEGNKDLVEEVVRMASKFGRQVATPEEARKILGLKV